MMQNAASCVVCGDMPCNWHFGAIVCEACRKFFFRTVTDLRIYSHCDNTGQPEPDPARQCRISRENRTLCKYCRYQKCIRVGMSIDCKSNQLNINNLIKTSDCLVCGLPSTGYHFGVMTCEACKGFYRRSLAKSTSYTCSREKNCDVMTSQRNSCKYCRYMKCVQVGMRSDAVQIGRKSNIDKHYLIQDSNQTTGKKRDSHEYNDQPSDSKRFRAESYNTDSYSSTSTDSQTSCQSADTKVFSSYHTQPYEQQHKWNQYHSNPYYFDQLYFNYCNNQAFASYYGQGSANTY